MNILIIGAGGREHALAWTLAKSPSVDRIFCAPGNGGIAAVATCVDIDVMDFSGLIGLCRAEEIEFVVVGPEAPLVEGLVDQLTSEGIPAFGPSAAAAQLEGSKGFTKDLCARHNIPTAAYGRFTDVDQAKAYIVQQGAPIVVKADGLAAGKGVIVAQTLDQALIAVDEIFAGAFGAAGAEVVIEECLIGEEASFFALVDGEHCLALASAQDHKPVGDGDVGPNTGGMGAYSPAPVIDDAMHNRIMDEIIRPTVSAMASEGHPFNGVLFAGLMITDKGPELIEYNTRFGDPECQALMSRLDSDLLPALMATADGSLDKIELSWRDEAALVVVMAARGYPGAYNKGSRIRNLDTAGELPGINVFHAGTAKKDEDIIATGGRVLGVTARAPDVALAQSLAYEAVDVIDWPEGFCRRDIGWRAIDRA
ncbi:MAG: phosphoribosylamine--glycine ligase [Alphaproteobacteria bacterium]|jgi:phosphoribosylamine---glycine ligase|nr:phosphoribosylamine--glycine ligase [Alphaproteobacteria bacterium]MBT4083369.1 phosphoribosylamine--glycine ligase [Alphaproteobacteria bacterium]MBT4542979.1 phosphoribosylamine--glycine ligase [Alphaproteobacteria bacterium]MBT5920235.1 phosphoribosylamine--glycine ligase [Alphaproteobacteria bacterium]MBT6384439.1 phosphoribosylamine--glycine ligase [Alphaproteobacteria bacterium]